MSKEPAIQNLETILTRMSYDTRKTFSENRKVFSEQFTTSDMEASEKETERASEKYWEKFKKQQIDKEYPNFCRYPQKAIKGFEYYIEGYCMYPSQKKMSSQREIVGIWIPLDAEIRFWDLQEVNEFSEKIWSNKKGNFKQDKNKFLTNMSTILPIGTVAEFTFKGQNYMAHVISYPPFDEWLFTGYRRQDGLVYEQPSAEFTGTTFQKFIDDYGTYLQWAGVVISIIVNIATKSNPYALAIEIIYEMAVAGMIAHREWEKGEYVSMVFTIITGLLPGLKTKGWFRGISDDVITSLSDDMARATIRTEEELLQFYNGLSPEKQRAFTKIFAQDEVSMGRLRQALSQIDNLDIPPGMDTKKFMKFIENYVDNNAEVFTQLKFWDKLWARELTANAAVGVLDIAVDQLWGKKLNDEQKQAIEWVLYKIPEEHQKEMIYNMAQKPEVIDGLVQHVKDGRAETANNVSEYFQEVAPGEMRKVGGQWVEVDSIEAPKPTVNTEPNKENLIKQGYISSEEYLKRGRPKFTAVEWLGDELWYKVEIKQNTEKDKHDSSTVSLDSQNK